jgi:hypothetical protein
MVNNYIYIAEQSFVSKYCFSLGKKYKTTNFEYIPILNNLDVEITDFVNSKFLIYLKRNKDTKSTLTGLCGYFECENILINENISKEINKNINVKVDKILYNNMISKYNLFENSKLIFIKYNSMTSFKNVVTNKMLLEFAEKKGSEIQIEKITKKYNLCNLLENENNQIEEIINLIEENQPNDEEEQEEQEEEENEEDEEENVEMIMMDIPILWNPCDEIIEKIENNAIKREHIKTHYSNCDDCEIVDNNKISPDFKKRITFNIIEKKEIVDKIIDTYHFSKKYIEKKNIFTECNMIENNINILYYKKNDELYNQSIFLINKL